jgi:adenine C2-methylase RlmN of 23S rRNA A2503 and tRNA A37
MGAHVHTMTRLNRGDDISAACGQLGGYKQQRPKANVAIAATE